MDVKTKSSTKISNNNKCKIVDQTKLSAKVTVGYKRKRKDDGELDQKLTLINRETSESSRMDTDYQEWLRRN